LKIAGVLGRDNILIYSENECYQLSSADALALVGEIKLMTNKVIAT